MLLQTNSYIVPREKQATHASLLARFKQTLCRLGCEAFDVFEQSGNNWDSGDTSGRFVQIIQFRDRQHQAQIQEAEKSDREAQLLISEFCELINFPYQQEHGFFAVGFYTNVFSKAAAGEVTDDPQVTEIDDDFFPLVEDDLIDDSVPLMRLVSSDESEDDLEITEETPATQTDLGRILDAGLMGDALDVPLAAELFDDEEAA